MLTADRDSRRRGEEGTGEVESLYGRTKGMKMGDRVAKEKPPEVGPGFSSTRRLVCVGVSACARVGVCVLG